MKGQSIVMEFIVFFLISFTFFTTVGFFFNRQNQHFSDQIFEYETKILNDIIITNTLKLNECKACDLMIISEDLPRKIGDKFYMSEFIPAQGVETTSIAKKPFSMASPIFNLNETYTISGRLESVNKRSKIEIKYADKTIKVD